MRRASPPAASGHQLISPPSSAMLLEMSRPPSIPSHPGPPPAFTSYTMPHALPSRPEPGAPAHANRPRASSGNRSNSQQLPSLRTLLEPELLDKKLPDVASRSTSTQYPSTGQVRYDSSSPTLKRRHDNEAYPHGYAEYSELNAATSGTPYLQRQPLSATNTDSQSATSSTPGSVFGTVGIDHHARSNFIHPPHHDQTSGISRQPLAVSDSLGPLGTQQNYDEFAETGRPIRRRLDGSSRAPIRSSRCLGQREMPGEGLCYIYEDGTYCRAIIDGEPVNPSWGITKAGKPRKRLAQACLTCREKKIKCEPGYPKCHQCTKSQRVCRGGPGQPSVGNMPEETSPPTSAPPYKVSSAEVLNLVTGPDRTHNSEHSREYSRKVEAWNAGNLSKGRNFRPTSIATSRDMSVHSVESDWSGSGNDQGADDHRRPSYQDQLALQWEHDPYETDPRLTLHLLDLYFLHAGGATFGMFPRRPFLAWVQTQREKDQDSLMLVYSILAVGSLYSSDPDKRALGRRFAGIASYASERRFGKFSLQLCQSRLMLGLYFLARAKSQDASEFIGAGLRVISALKLNAEEGVQNVAIGSGPTYGLERLVFAECCRRTFWVGLLLDRYNGFFTSSMFTISVEDIFVRLPCAEDMFEASTPRSAPFLDDQILRERNPPLLGSMAYLCLISIFWGDILSFTNRAAHRPDNGYEQYYEAFYTNSYEKLEAWQTMLPTELRYSPQNLDKSISEGYVGTFMTLHALYHAAIIQLNRHVRVRVMPYEKIRRNVEHAFRNASNFLSMMHSLAAITHQQGLSRNTATDFVFATPFPSYALLLAVDVLTSTGTFSTLSNLMATVGATLSCVDDLANFWAPTRPHQRAVSDRLKQLAELSSQDGQDSRNGNYGQFWRLKDSLEPAFTTDDAAYHAEEQVLFDVVRQLTAR